jgi:type IV pilus assembly protein PilW
MRPNPHIQRRALAGTRRTPASQSGFTLVELMVGVAMSLLILLVATGMFSASSSAEKSNVGSSELATNGRYALDSLRRELLHAGFKALTWTPLTSPTTTLPSVAGDCSPSFAISLDRTLWASNNSNPFPNTCIPAAGYARGDVMAVWRTSVAPSTVLKTSTIYLRSSYDKGELFQGATPPPLFIGTPQEDHALEFNVFYVSPYTASPDEQPRVPALYRATLGPGPTITRALVASNVEDFQVQLGRTSPSGTQYVNASALSTTTTPSQWDEVFSVRLWILVRSSLPETGLTGTTTFSLGDRRAVFNDGYKRDVFSTVVRVRNKSSADDS